MKGKALKYIITAHWVLLIISCSCSSKRSSLNLPDHLQEIGVNTKLTMADMHSKKIKVVAFFRRDWGIKHTLPLYNKFIDKYSNIGFIFYISKTETRLEEILGNDLINYPYYYDPNCEFLKSNNPLIRQDLSFMGFIINAENEIVKISNPSLSNFENLLIQYSSTN